MTIDFFINGLRTENRLRSQRTPKPYKNKLNNCKLIDLVIRIELTRAILVLRFLNFMKNSIVHFRMFFIFGNIFSESHGFVAMPVTSRIIETCSNLSLSD